MKSPAAMLVLLFCGATIAMPQSKSWRGTWTATVGGGSSVLGGTWDASLAQDPDTVQGNWTLSDPNGATLAQGTWAARKDAKAWKGTWQARGATGQTYSGTWRTQARLPAGVHMQELFDLALTKAISGTWQMSTYSGAWSIRAYPRD